MRRLPPDRLVAALDLAEHIMSEPGRRKASENLLAQALLDLADEMRPSPHAVPDPPTQDGCTSCQNDLHHGMKVGDMVVVRAPMTRKFGGVIHGFAVDKADVIIPGKTYPLTVHTKWLQPVTHFPRDTEPYSAMFHPEVT